MDKRFSGPRFARRLGQMRPSTIREILKATTQPDMISFAGGLPAPELFPVEGIRAACDRVLSTQGWSALQYGESEGYRPLRQELAGEMLRRGVACDGDGLIVTSGSQQALDLVGRAFLDPGDVVLTESPTYLAAIQAFQSWRPGSRRCPRTSRG
jgi:2-aminoadipate transaminase